MTKRRSNLRTFVAGGLAALALATTVAVLWRWVASAPPEAPQAGVATTNDTTRPDGEDFSNSERHGLEAILRKKNPSAQR